MPDSGTHHPIHDLDWGELLPIPVVEVSSVLDSDAADRVGGVAMSRGTWWGMIIARCDRPLALAVARSYEVESTDEAMRLLVMKIARVLVQRLDADAKLSSTVALDRENVDWRPASGRLQARVGVGTGAGILCVEVYRRTRSDEIAALADA